MQGFITDGQEELSVATTISGCASLHHPGGSRIARYEISSGYEPFSQFGSLPNRYSVNNAKAMEMYPKMHT
jgi:hypothetical protein